VSIVPLDALLAGSVVWLAWKALHGDDLFRCVVLFIAFGLLMAVVWARLDAPDIALAEAAIGAGLSGALLLSAVAGLGAQAHAGDEVGGTSGGVARLLGVVTPVALAGVGLAAAWRLEGGGGAVAAAVVENLPAAGVSNSVTAVLLNYRAYDTWLELVVLLVALLAVQALLREAEPAPPALPWRTGGMLPRAAPLLLPLMLLVGGYLLWRGTHAAGGAFQAGAVLGAAGVLLILAGRSEVLLLRGTLLRLALASGGAAFLLAALASALGGRAFLQYPLAGTATAIVLVESAATIAIALTLTALFAGSSRRPEPLPPPDGLEPATEPAR
jgi:multisubunit Na+/H+ antiporter MnhB subunit